MSDGTVPLHRYPRRKVAFACRTCSRAGRYDKATLIERVGLDENLVVLRLKIAEGLGCEPARAILAGEPVPVYSRCGAYYPELR